MTGLLVAVSAAAWYAVARWLEPRLPDWLTRFVLGSAAAPTYAKHSADGRAVIVASLPVATADGAPVTLSVLPELVDDADPADQHLGYDVDTIEMVQRVPFTGWPVPRP